MTFTVDDRPPASRGRLWGEILLVLGVSLGASAVYSIVSITDRLTREESLSQQSTTLNASRNPREAFDFTYQFLGIFFDLVPVALVCWLLWSTARPHLGRLGIDLKRPGRDLAWGVVLALSIGTAGIVLYAVGRATGFTVAVDPTGLDWHWWTVPILLLSAFRAGATEEVIVIGYLFARLRDLGWGRWQIIVSTAVLRATYHLYQGIGPFIGNLLMGLIFGWLYSRTKRVLPFVIAHTIIDAAIFIGYPWAAGAFPELLGIPAAD